jgi:hypothetical protein
MGADVAMECSEMTDYVLIYNAAGKSALAQFRRRLEEPSQLAAE